MSDLPLVPQPSPAPAPGWNALPPTPEPARVPPTTPLPPTVPFEPSAYAAPNDSPAAGGRRRWIAIAAIVALLAGVGVGYAAAQPSKHDVAEQRTRLQSQLDPLQRDLANAQAATASASSERDTCADAVTGAKDLIGKQADLWTLIDAYETSAVGSPEETQLLDQIDAAHTNVIAETAVVMLKIGACLPNGA
jgi:hypothetical protein